MRVSINCLSELGFVGFLGLVGKYQIGKCDKGENEIALIPTGLNMNKLRGEVVRTLNGFDKS